MLRFVGWRNDQVPVTRCSRRRGHIVFLGFIAHSAPAAAELGRSAVKQPEAARGAGAIDRVDRASACEDGTRGVLSCGRAMFVVALLAILIRTHKHLRCIGEKK